MTTSKKRKSLWLTLAVNVSEKQILVVGFHPTKEKSIRKCKGRTNLPTERFNLSDSIERIHGRISLWLCDEADMTALEAKGAIKELFKSIKEMLKI